MATHAHRRQGHPNAHAADLDELQRERDQRDRDERTLTPRLLRLLAELDALQEELEAARRDREAGALQFLMEDLRLGLGSEEITDDRERAVRAAWLVVGGQGRVS